MVTDMSENTTLGQQMLSYLAAKGRKSRKAGTATVAEWAEKLGVTSKAVADRAWWMQHKDGILVSTGKGKERVYRTKPTKRASTRVEAAVEATTATPAEAPADQPSEG